MIIKPKKLNKNDNVSIISPCFSFEQSEISIVNQSLNKLYLNPIFSKNLLLKTNSFSASIKERADDFNNSILNNDIKMIIFEGGEVSNELLPFIDYESIKNHPKIIISYSDSTTILNAISAKTQLVTFYGQSYRSTLYSTYNTNRFTDVLMQTDTPKFPIENGCDVIFEGVATGRLIGGYLLNFSLMMNSKYLPFDKDEDYILFIEDNICFNSPAAVSRYLYNIAQSDFFSNVKGLIIGHYSLKNIPEFNSLIERFSKEFKLPTLKTNNFGHCDIQNIIPIGIKATLNTTKKSLQFLENAVY